MIATTSIIQFATTTQMLDPEVYIWITTAIMNGVLLGLFIGLLSRATWWIW